jgi:hypothetical protein
LSRKPKAALLVIATAMAVLFSGLVASPAFADTTGPIKNFGNHKCIDVSTQTNHYVQLWSCNGQSQQNWTESFQPNYTFRFISQRNGQCLGADVITAGARTATVPCGPLTEWNVKFANNFGTGWHQQLELGHTNLCLDLQDNRSADGTPITLWWCWGADQESNPAQLWIL